VQLTVAVAAVTVLDRFGWTPSSRLPLPAGNICGSGLVPSLDRDARQAVSRAHSERLAGMPLALVPTRVGSCNETDVPVKDAASSPDPERG
jgi:hypothetical protein